VYGVCVPGSDRTAFSVTTEIKAMLNTASATAFSSATAGATDGSTVAGCVVPDPFYPWTAGLVTVGALPGAAAAACAGVAPATVLGGGIANPTALPFKGVAIECDRNAGYYPVRGFEGTNLCINAYILDAGAGSTVGAGASGPFIKATNAAYINDYWATPGMFSALGNGTDPLGAYGIPDFSSATSSLVCAQGCTLPPSVCTGAGVLHANVLGAGSGWVPGTCMIRPNRTAPGAFYMPSSTFQIACASAAGRGTTYTYTCGATIATDGTVTQLATFTPAYTAECGTADGAESTPLWNRNGQLDGWASPITQAAGQITNFPSVVSVLSKAYAVIPASSYFAAFGRRHWNNNPVQKLNDGQVYRIAVDGCNNTNLATQDQCVQQTLNWWRCHYGFPFNGATVCYSASRPIACPVEELGFRCPSSSKKGLLGLLGLLGLIPLLLLCCCLFFLCCIRRRKTEADVHFATFDPHAAPVIATAPCATATACPTAFGATPFATHPSAIPCL